MGKRKKKVNVQVIGNIAKIKDINKILYFGMIVLAIVFVFSIFATTYKMEGEFRVLNSQDVANATGAPYSVIMMNENVRFYNFVFGIASETIGYNYFQPSMLVLYIVQFILIGLFFIPLTGRIKKANKYKNIVVGILLIAASICYASYISSFQVILEDVLYDIITVMQYLAESPYSVTPGAMISVSVGCMSLAGIISITRGVCSFYLEKNNESF